MRFSFTKNERTQVAVAATCGIAAVLACYGLIIRHDTPVGLDGYHYVLEVESVLRDGWSEFWSPFKLPIYLMALAAALVGDTMLGIRVFALLIAAVLSVIVFVIVRQQTSSWLAAASGQAICILHSSMAFYIVEYVNNLFGVVMFALMVLAQMRGHTGDRPRRRFVTITAVAAGVLAVVSHRMTAGLVLLYAAAKVLVRHGNPARLYSIAAWSIPVLTAVIMVAHHALATSNLGVRIGRELSPVPFQELFAASTLPGSLLLVCAAVPIVRQYLEHACEQGTDRSVWPEWIALLVVVAVTAMNPWLRYGVGLQSIADRLRLAEGVFLSMLLPFGMTLVWRMYRPHRWVAVVAIVLALVVGVSGRVPAGIQPAFLAEQREA